MAGDKKEFLRGQFSCLPRPRELDRCRIFFSEKGVNHMSKVRCTTTEISHVFRLFQPFRTTGVKKGDRPIGKKSHFGYSPSRVFPRCFRRDRTIGQKYCTEKLRLFYLSDVRWSLPWDPHEVLYDPVVLLWPVRGPLLPGGRQGEHWPAPAVPAPSQGGQALPQGLKDVHGAVALNAAEAWNWKREKYNKYTSSIPVCGKFESLCEKTSSIGLEQQ